MEQKKLRLWVKKMRPNAKVPRRATSRSAGLDLYACLDEPVVIYPGTLPQKIPTGIAVAPDGDFFLQVLPRSGLSLRGLLIHTGTIDPDYRGEVHVIASNIGDAPIRIDHGMRIAQLVAYWFLSPVPLLTTVLDETERGKGGFGSSGLY